MIGIASSRRWHQAAFDEIEKRIGKPILRITNTAELNTAHLREHDIEKIFFLHWSSIIPAEIHRSFECIIFHMTALPYGRGGSPLQNLIVRGHKRTAVTAFRCDDGIDSGPIYLQYPLDLDGPARRIFERATEVMLGLVEVIVREKPVSVPQQGTPEVFIRRRPEESNLELATDADRAYDLIRMMDAEGYPHAFLETATLRLEFTDAVRDGDECRATVTVKKK